MENICPSFVLSIDQGTSSSRAILFSKDGSVASMHQLEHQQFYPCPGWVEHDAEEIWRSVKECVERATEKAKASAKNIAAIGITNQRETTVVWNKHSGKPYNNAIVWNDTRTRSICDRLSKIGGQDRFRSKTGLPLATYFSFSKLIYLLETVPCLLEDALRGDALFGTIDTFLIWKLTGGKVHATDVTNASRTLLMNLSTLEWDDEILAAFKIPLRMLPAIFSSSEVFGLVATSSPSNNYGIDAVAGVPIGGVLGDQQAALFGQTCLRVGDAKCTYGTGAFLLMNTGKNIVHSDSGLLTTVAYKLGKDSPPIYALEGSVAYSGSLIQWLRDNIQIISSAQASEEIAREVEDNGGVYFVPAFAGLYAPYWRGDARGCICGLTAFNTKHHIVRAALEAAAFQVAEVLEAMKMDSAVDILTLKVDGGMTKNNLLMQFQSDIIGAPLAAPSVVETTALGAAFAAGLAVGFWKETDFQRIWMMGNEWRPAMPLAERQDRMRMWHKALARSLLWVEKDAGEVVDDTYLSFLKREKEGKRKEINQKQNFITRISEMAGLSPTTLGLSTVVVCMTFFSFIISRRKQ